MKKILLTVLALSLLMPAPAHTQGRTPENTETKIHAQKISATAEGVPVEVFVTSWCPYCRRLESFLKDQGIPYTRYDIESSADGAALFDKIGGRGVPVTRVNHEDVVHGFDPEGIMQAIGRHR